MARFERYEAHRSMQQPAHRSFQGFRRPRLQTARPGGRVAAQTDSVLEALEARTLLSSASLSGGVLDIEGGPDPRLVVHVGYDARHDQLDVHVRGQKPLSFARAAVSGLKITGTNGDDRIILSADEPVPAVINGLDGNDVIIGGAAGDTVACGAGKDHVWGRGGNDTLCAAPAPRGCSAAPGTTPSSPERARACSTVAPGTTSLSAASDAPGWSTVGP